MLDFRARLDFTDSVQETGIKQRTALALRDEQTLAFQVRPAKFVDTRAAGGRRQADKQGSRQRISDRQPLSGAAIPDESDIELSAQNRQTEGNKVRPPTPSLP